MAAFNAVGFWESAARTFSKRPLPLPLIRERYDIGGRGVYF
ncbi:hypothetical protein ANASTE_01602 [Anaerofustis stercorihominis DSM 17244]|uniref:Uncharacterized protein n=1 Tax=Anaerofustis stercorihominis DSM 17244 TaxID=445971 RepID=B1C8I8_9FIRM|nr:hypothetical protein ANASTE_01602 [Anaerofustis stercorihominis DSM 17244]